MRSLEARIARLEARLQDGPAPHVLHVRFGEAFAEAIERFRRKWLVGKSHRLLVVPAPIETPEQEAEFACRFKLQQMALVADGKQDSSRRAANPPVEPPTPLAPEMKSVERTRIGGRVRVGSPFNAKARR